jgi:hypothetical protein
MSPQSLQTPSPTDSFITIVSGLPRSGTSMMMRILQAGGLPVLSDGVRRADQDNPNGYYEFEAVKRIKQDASWIPAARGKAVKMVYALLYDLPPTEHYRILFMKRRLEEVVRSQEVMLHRMGAPDEPVPTNELVAGFERAVRAVDAWMARQPHMRSLSVDYNQIISDPAPTIDQVRSFLGGDSGESRGTPMNPALLDRQAMIAAIDPSLYRQRS